MTNMKIKTLLAVAALLPISLFAADVTGTWKSDFETQIGHQEYTFTLKQDGAMLTGKANSVAGERKREADLKEGKIEGDTVSFAEMLTIQDNEIRVSYTGKLSADGNEIKLTRAVGDFGKTEIVAKRGKSRHLQQPRRARTSSGSKRAARRRSPIPAATNGPRSKVSRAATLSSVIQPRRLPEPRIRSCS